MKTAKAKAYECTNWEDLAEGEGTEIIFAETVNEAKGVYAREYGADYEDVRVRRVEWADKYAKTGVPDRAYLDHGWWLYCRGGCGRQVNADEHIIADGKAYCSKCAKKRSFMINRGG